MREAIERQWTSYFYSGSIALIVSWVLMLTLSGCRVGNHTSDSPPPDTGVSGFYLTQPQGQTFAVTADSQTVNVPMSQLSQIGASYTTNDSNYLLMHFADFLTNPATFIEIDPSTGETAIFPPTNGTPSIFQPVFVNSDGTFDVAETTHTQWNGLDCTITRELQISGKTLALQPSDPTTASTSIGTVNLKGHLAFQVMYATSSSGSACSAALQSISACYSTLSSCPGATPGDQDSFQSIVKGIYGFFVDTAEVLTPAQIATTQNLGLVVNYQ
jgi:hypothetical protein